MQLTEFGLIVRPDLDRIYEMCEAIVILAASRSARGEAHTVPDG